MIPVAVAAPSQASAAETSQTAKEHSSSLYQRLSALAATGGSVSETIDQYLGEGKSVTEYELKSCLKELRKYYRFPESIDLMEWMEKRGISLSDSECALRIDLLSRVKGITSAENCFNKLSPPAKNQLTYGALLDSYCKEEMTKKAVALFEKIKGLNFASTSNYNSIMCLHVRQGKPKKAILLVQEMKKKGIQLDTFTYNVLMQSYASLKDTEAVIRVLAEMETEDGDKCDWTTYSNLASIYVEAKLFEKAELGLKEVEKKMKPRDLMAYHFLISLYAGTSNLEEIKRVWSSYRSAFSKTNNMTYLHMLDALSMLDDFDGLKKFFKEWEAGCSSYDIRLAKVMIRAYLKRDMIKEAELVLQGAIDRGSVPNFMIFKLFIDYFMKVRQVDLAMKYMEAGATKIEVNEKEMLTSSLEYFAEEGDVDGVDEFCWLMRIF